MVIILHRFLLRCERKLGAVGLLSSYAGRYDNASTAAKMVVRENGLGPSLSVVAKPISKGRKACRVVYPSRTGTP